MSSLTSRIKILKAALTDPANYTTYIADGFDKIDAAIGLTTCTSTTRPASPYVGQWILETDTNRRAHWDGTGWKCTTGGTFTAATNGSGDLTFTGHPMSTWNWIVANNGDTVARGSIVVGGYAQPWSSGNNPMWRIYTSSTGAAVTGANTRLAWVGEGYLA